MIWHTSRRVPFKFDILILKNKYKQTSKEHQSITEKLNFTIINQFQGSLSNYKTI